MKQTLTMTYVLLRRTELPELLGRQEHGRPRPQVARRLPLGRARQRDVRRPKVSGDGAEDILGGAFCVLRSASCVYPSFGPCFVSAPISAST
jgi:hypothetical protein